MIQISQEARALLRRLLSDEDDAGRAGRGVQITAVAEGGDTGFEIQIAGRPAPGETVIETGGVRLFLDSHAADALDDAELVVEDGELALAVPELAGAPGCGDT